MGPGFKYHVVTIAAIFFALAIGLVVGSLFASPSLADRQKRAIASLQNTLNKDNADLRQDLGRYREFASETMPLLLRGRLANAPVAIIQTGDYADALPNLRAALEMAGARVLSVTTIDRAFARPDELLNPDLTTLHNADARFPVNREGLADRLAGILARGDSPVDSLMAALEHENFLRADAGGDFLTPARYVVVLAGRRSEVSNRPAYVDQPLVVALQKQGLTVVACEPQNAVASDIAAYHALNLDLTTVNNIDTDIGRCALVFALNLAPGGDKNDYGVKPTASQLLPPLTDTPNKP